MVCVYRGCEHPGFIHLTTGDMPREDATYQGISFCSPAHMLLELQEEDSRSVDLLQHALVRRSVIR